jgi:hypothetical protein
MLGDKRSVGFLVVAINKFLEPECVRLSVGEQGREGIEVMDESVGFELE